MATELFEGKLDSSAPVALGGCLQGLKNKIVNHLVLIRLSFKVRGKHRV